MTVRDGVEGAILMSVGAAALTRERAEAAAADLVRRGQVSAEDGRAALEGLLGKARVDGMDPGGLLDKLPSGVRDALGELGLLTRTDLDDVELRLNELDHRLRLVEGHDPPPGDEEDSES